MWPPALRSKRAIHVPLEACVLEMEHWHWLPSARAVLALVHFLPMPCLNNALPVKVPCSPPLCPLFQVPASPRYYTYNYTQGIIDTPSSNPHELVSALPPCYSPGPCVGTPPIANPSIATPLQLFRSRFANGEEVLDDWAGEDPCNHGYAGVTCTDGLVSEM